MHNNAAPAYLCEALSMAEPWASTGLYQRALRAQANPALLYVGVDVGLTASRSRRYFTGA